MKLKRLNEQYFYGCKDVEVIMHGSWADPEIVYDGESFNYWKVENDLWHEFCLENGYKNADNEDPTIAQEFKAYVKANCKDFLDSVMPSEDNGFHSYYSYDESYNKENKSRKINEGYLYDNFGDFEVHKLSMDVLFPEGTVVSQNLLHRLYEAISDALEKEGCLMAGDYLEDEGGSNELSRVYHDNDF